MHDIARNYQRYALGLLAITLLMGVALIALAASDGAQLMERVKRSGWLRARPRVEGAPESVNC